MMRAAETLICWQPVDREWTGGYKGGPPGSIAVGPLLSEYDSDWTAPYTCSGGASWMYRRKLSGMPQQFHVMRDWYMLVYVYAMHPYVVHRAFLLIAEYQAVIKAMGAGPAKDEHGHDPEVGHGPAVQMPKPRITVATFGQSTHFWPFVTPNEALVREVSSILKPGAGNDAV